MAGRVGAPAGEAALRAGRLREGPCGSAAPLTELTPGVRDGYRGRCGRGGIRRLCAGRPAQRGRASVRRAHRGVPMTGLQLAATATPPMSSSVSGCDHRRARRRRGRSAAAAPAPWPSVSWIFRKA